MSSVELLKALGNLPGPVERRNAVKKFKAHRKLSLGGPANIDWSFAAPRYDYKTRSYKGGGLCYVGNDPSQDTWENAQAAAKAYADMSPLVKVENMRYRDFDKKTGEHTPYVRPEPQRVVLGRRKAPAKPVAEKAPVLVLGADFDTEEPVAPHVAAGDAFLS